MLAQVTEQVKVVIEYVERSGRFEVSEGDIFHGAFDTITDAHAMAWKVCPAGGAVVGDNLTDDEFHELGRLHKAANDAAELEAFYQVNPWARPGRRAGHMPGSGRFTHRDGAYY